MLKSDSDNTILTATTGKLTNGIFVIQLEDQSFGYTFKSGPFVGGFGNRHGSLELLKNHYPQFKLFGVKQTHSDAVHVFNNEYSDKFEADAIIGQEAGVIYYIKTADCIPVLLIDQQSGAMAAIHAGWKGVANRIVPKTISKWQKMTQGPATNLAVLIGPHIQKPSFEIELPVLEQLKSSVLDWPEDACEKKGNKFYVDLNQIVKLQLAESGIQADQVNSLMIDTKTNLEFHSYRRDRENSGRQISFIGRQA